MHAIENTEFCRLLIDSGANVNAQDNTGNTALHRAMNMDCEDTVQLLIANRSNPYIPNNCGYDAIRMASLGGNETSLTNLRRMNPPIERLLESFQLLGAYHIYHENNLDKAISAWEEAVELLLTCKIFRKKNYLPKPVFQFVTEFHNQHDLKSLAQDEDMMRMYALQTCEEILGPKDEFTLSALSQQGDEYVYEKDILQRCIEMRMYSLTLQVSCAVKLTKMYDENMMKLC